MATIFDAAKFILEELGQTSTMKLQKLCYYAQAWSLVWDHAPLFEEDFQAWVNGPMCPELFYRLKEQFSYVADDIPGDSSMFSDMQRETLRQVLNYYGDKDMQWLSQLTRMEDPWKQAFAVSDKAVMAKESICTYYHMRRKTPCFSNGDISHALISIKVR